MGQWDNGMVEVGFNPGKLCKQSSIYIHLHPFTINVSISNWQPSEMIEYTFHFQVSVPDWTTVANCAGHGSLVYAEYNGVYTRVCTEYILYTEIYRVYYMQCRVYTYMYTYDI